MDYETAGKKRMNNSRSLTSLFHSSLFVSGFGDCHHISSCIERDKKKNSSSRGRHISVGAGFIIFCCPSWYLYRISIIQSSHARHGKHIIGRSCIDKKVEHTKEYFKKERRAICHMGKSFLHITISRLPCYSPLHRGTLLFYFSLTHTQ